jgi:hypothetical protein
MKPILGITSKSRNKLSVITEHTVYQRRAHSNNSCSSLSGEMGAKPLLISLARKINRENILTDKEQWLINLARKRFF